jgi:penicillin-binding protein 2
MMVDRRLEARQKFFRWLIIAVFGLIAIRLITLQLCEASVYRTKAALNRFRFLPILAPRGDIVDAKGTILAGNKIVNTISIVPQQVDDPGKLRDTINNLVALLHDSYPDIDAPYINKLLDDAKQSGRSYEPVVIKQDVPMDMVERLEEHRQDLPGVEIAKALVRNYPEGTVASHLLGYIGEISSDELEHHKDEKYQAGDLIGRSGLEEQYESFLRGQDGFQEVEVDVSGRPVPHANLITVPPVQGDKLVLTIDNNLQMAMETSMDNTMALLRSEGYDTRAGAAVALDVKTGAVLAMTSRPNFDPNALVPPVDTATVKKYISPPAGSESPMINRVISSRYAPGSTFKPITGMAALASGKITVDDMVDCTGRYWLPPYPSCWEVHGITNFFKAMAESCDVYFYEAGRRAGAGLMARVAHEFGLDQPTGIDLPGEATGILSSPDQQRVQQDAYWRKWYQDQETALNSKYAALLAAATTAQQKRDLQIQQQWAQRSLDEDYRIKYNFYVNWQPFETFNMAIGQGANAFTPIELADYMAQLANNGQRMRPYLVQQIVDPGGKVVARFGPQVAHIADVDTAGTMDFNQVMDTVRQALAGSTDPSGTSGLLFLNYPIKVAAKTGSAETGGKLDLCNGLFVAFAPVNDPTIAFAGVIETAHHGSDSAGYVGKAVLDQYFGLNKPAAQAQPARTNTQQQPARTQAQPSQTQPQQPAQTQPATTQPQQPATTPPATTQQQPATAPPATTQPRAGPAP